MGVKAYPDAGNAKCVSEGVRNKECVGCGVSDKDCVGRGVMDKECVERGVRDKECVGKGCEGQRVCQRVYKTKCVPEGVRDIV